MSIYQQLHVIQTRLNVPKNQFNNFGKYSYRSCEDILEAVKPLLNGLSLLLCDEMVLIGDRHYLKATATLTDGTDKISVAAYAREENEKKGMDSAQLTGATSSYARKYALAGLFLLDDNKDADSTNEHGKGKEEKPKATTPPTTPPPSDETQGDEMLMVFAEITDVRKITGKSRAGKDYTRYVIKDEKGNEYKTFSESFAKYAKESIGSGLSLRISYTVSKFGNDLTNIELPQTDELMGE